MKNFGLSELRFTLTPDERDSSGGQQQRVALARALASEPALLLARRAAFGPGRTGTDENAK